MEKLGNRAGEVESEAVVKMYDDRLACLGRENGRYPGHFIV